MSRICSLAAGIWRMALVVGVFSKFETVTAQLKKDGRCARRDEVGSLSSVVEVAEPNNPLSFRDLA